LAQCSAVHLSMELELHIVKLNLVVGTLCQLRRDGGHTFPGSRVAWHKASDEQGISSHANPLYYCFVLSKAAPPLRTRTSTTCFAFASMVLDSPEILPGPLKCTICSSCSSCTFKTECNWRTAFPLPTYPGSSLSVPFC
jgi:hypothetical protein